MRPLLASAGLICHVTWQTKALTAGRCAYDQANGGRPSEETVLMRSDLGAVLGELPLFNGLDAGLLRQIARGGRMAVAARAARRCSRAGEPPDALYVVLSGCLGRLSARPDRPAQSMGRVVCRRARLARWG